MRILQISNLINKFSTSTQPFAQFLANKESAIQTKRTTNRLVQGLDFHVSRIAMCRDQATEFMMKKGITKKNVLINVDASHLMGMKRLICKNYMNVNIYKGKGQPVDILTKQNPIKFTKVQQLVFDADIFASTDSYYLQKINSKDIDQQKLAEEVSQLYKLDCHRGGNRLLSQYSIPPQYIPIIQAAHNLENVIYFVGLNQYDIRQIVSAYLSINELKVLFMQCLNYVGNEGLTGAEQIEKYFRFKCKEFLWKEHYSFLQPINYQQIKIFRKKVNGYYFAHSYNFLSPQNPNINFQRLKDTQPDSTKLQKQAILSVLFGNIWKQPYTNNPFPYLAQNYINLSVDDKTTVIDLYNKHYQRYTAAKNKFFQQREQIKTAL